MLFNSFVFVFLFLPVSVIIFYVLPKNLSAKAPLIWLLLVSIMFYAWWNPWNTFLLLFSILFNFLLGRLLFSRKGRDVRKILLITGICVNLSLLAYFKYANFFLDSLNSVFHGHYPVLHILLPIGISFFTFQQIMYLVECYRQENYEPNLINYALFVSFFPHLIAGPIVYPRVLLPQLRRLHLVRFKSMNFAVGMTIFTIGLFKKVILADSLIPFSDYVFKANGYTLTFLDSWMGVLAFALQIYFDFSGYSDMATGLARLFGLRLPINFFSPYKALNIIDFWRRWHITLSNFLRVYLYIPLGGNRLGEARRYANILMTMLLGGLWHGAGWTFVIWGALHGCYLILNHFWQDVLEHLHWRRFFDNFVMRGLGFFLTFFSVTVAWVFFKAKTLDSAFNILNAMTGGNGVMLWGSQRLLLNKFFHFGDVLAGWGVHFETPRSFIGLKGFELILMMLLIVWLLPNTYELMAKYRPNYHIAKYYHEDLRKSFRWRPSPWWAVFYAAIFVYAVFSLSKVSEFIYYQF